MERLTGRWLGRDAAAGRRPPARPCSGAAFFSGPLAGQGAATARSSSSTRDGAMPACPRGSRPQAFRSPSRAKHVRFTQRTRRGAHGLARRDQPPRRRGRRVKLVLLGQARPVAGPPRSAGRHDRYRRQIIGGLLHMIASGLPCLLEGLGGVASCGGTRNSSWARSKGGDRRRHGARATPSNSGERQAAPEMWGRQHRSREPKRPVPLHEPLRRLARRRPACQSRCRSGTLPRENPPAASGRRRARSGASLESPTEAATGRHQPAFEDSDGRRCGPPAA